MASSDGPSMTDLLAAIARRDRELAQALAQLDESQLAAESLLPGWSVLTVVCHLRYGARATLTMTEDILAGRPASFYPGGRTAQRAATLAPEPGERDSDVVASLVAACRALGHRWSTLQDRDWQRLLVEPEGNVDLGPVTLATLALLRLTEVEVHGTDLGLGLPDWSDEFVAAALPMRVDWLTGRRSNQRSPDLSIDGRWLFLSDEGPDYSISATGPDVEVAVGVGVEVAVEVGAEPLPGLAIIEGRSRDLLGLLLGRTPLQELRLSGDRALAHRFSDAFPPP